LLHFLVLLHLGFFLEKDQLLVLLFRFGHCRLINRLEVIGRLVHNLPAPKLDHLLHAALAGLTVHGALVLVEQKLLF
jgi:hypothetical protein